MNHPSLFTLMGLVDASLVLEDDVVAHVSACPTCHASLVRLARRALEHRGLAAELDLAEARPVSTPLAAFVAVAAAMAVMVTSHPLLPTSMTDTRLDAARGCLQAPEGVHGVVLELGPLPVHPSAGLLDGGARLGGD